jgi:hypothetical protein
MKRVTDPALLAQLDHKSSAVNNTALSTQLNQEIEQHNPLFNLLAGAGGAIQNGLAALPFSPFTKAPPPQGIEGEIGNIGGNFIPFTAGAKVLNGARILSESLPMIGRLAKALSGEGARGMARRIIGTSIGGALENSDDRTSGALKGALLGGAAESIPALGQALLKVPEKINPKQYTSNLADAIRQSYNKSRGQSEENYNNVMNKVGGYPIDHPNLLYPNLDKRFMRAYSGGENLLHQDYITKPTIEKAHFLQSQIGHKIRELQSNPNKDPATINAIKDLNYVHGSLLSDLNSALQRIHPDIANEYQAAAEFHRKNVVPFEQNKLIRNISEGETKNSKPSALLSALTQLTQSEKKDVPSEHFLKAAQNDLNKRINKGKLLKDIVTGGTGAAIGMAVHPGLWPAALGLAGGGFFGHYGLPRLLRVVENPEAKLDRLNLPYRVLATGAVSNLLPQRDNNQ